MVRFERVTEASARTMVGGYPLDSLAKKMCVPVMMELKSS